MENHIPNTEPSMRLEGELNLRGAADLRARLLKALTAGASIVIDARQVTAIDAGIVQVFISARESAVRLGRNFTLIADAGGAVQKTLSQLGVAPMTTDASAAELPAP